MLLTIHDQHLNKVAFIDNNKQKTLNYYGDTWRRQLETGSSTFEFTVFKRTVQSDTSSKQAYKSLNDKAFVSFKYKRKTYVFNIMKITEDEQTIKCYCENLNLELLNEYVNPYKASEALTFKQYCDNLGLLNFSLLSIGINEIADRKLTLEWTGQDTKLARLLSLANKFNAEIEFDTQLNPNSTLKSFKVNVYHENDEDHQGVGRVRTDIRLEYKKNLKSIKRTVDKTSIFNAVRPVGKNSEGNEVTIGGMIDPIKERNAKGILEFYQEGETLFAPISQQMYPSVFAPENSDDQWIRKDMTVESDNQKVIRAAGLKALKKAAYPAVTYEIDGFLDVEIGDTIQIYDNGFSPALNIRARVSEQTISFTNPQNNKTTFANFKELENRISSNLQARLEQLIDESRPYVIRLSASNGVVFKNNTGTSIITPTLLKGSKELSEVVWKWQLGNTAIITGNTYTANGSLITGAVTLTAIAFLNNKEVARDSLSLANVNDGAAGVPGKPGADGNGTKLFSTNTRYTQFAFDSYAKGTIDTFGVNESTDDTKVGDAVYIKAFNIDKNAYAWIVGTVTEIISAGKIKVQSKGVIENGADGVFDGVVGRRNLLKGTKLLEGIKSTGEYNGFKTLKSVINSESDKIIDPYTAPTTVPMTSTEYILVFWARASRNDYRCVCHLFDPNTVTKAKTSTGYVANNKLDGYAECNLTTEWKQYWVKWTQTPSDRTKKVIIGRHGYNYASSKGDWLEICAPCLFEGGVVGDHIDAPEDIEKVISSKADQAITQEQLNKLAERDALLKAEMETKAAQALVETWINEIKNLAAVDEAGRKEAEAAAIRASERIVDLQRKVGELKIMTEFVDTYMSQSEEGLIVGRKDGSSKVLVSNDRISFISGGKEVASISQGVLQIDNGVFVKSLRIGRFVTIQDPTNPNRNLTLYVGGA
ncbi:TPA: phage tail protein [Streptococcus pyogenes]|nr:phage tail protein [Streptococcus pyogenes]